MKPNNISQHVRFASIAKPFIFLIMSWIVYVLCSDRFIEPFSIIYFCLIIVNTIILSFIMDKSLINERASIKENTNKNDIIYALIVGRIGPLLILIVSGLDNRFIWTAQFPLYVKIVSILIMIISLLLTDWAVVVNRYFSGVVRIQKERGHKVITNGPYKIVRHPGYLGTIIYSVVTPLLLNSSWGIIPAILVVIITGIRTKKEDEYLRNELKDYKEYCEKVKYKLIPYIW